MSAKHDVNEQYLEGDFGNEKNYWALSHFFFMMETEHNSNIFTTSLLQFLSKNGRKTKN